MKTLCPKCNQPAILGTSPLTCFIPDDEPFEEGETKDIDEFDIDQMLNLYYCRKCNKVVESWFE